MQQLQHTAARLAACIAVQHQQVPCEVGSVCPHLRCCQVWRKKKAAEAKKAAGKGKGGKAAAGKAASKGKN
jgi:hypothetical protein